MAERQFKIGRHNGQICYDLTGERFGRLVAVRPAPQRGNSPMWECKCDCGNAKMVKGYNLRTGQTKSCGCLKAELQKPKPKEPEKPQPKKFVPADKRCSQCVYYTTLAPSAGAGQRACHYMLWEGKRRERISETECGSFQDKRFAKPVKRSFEDVPMQQWGTGGVSLKWGDGRLEGRI